METNVCIAMGTARVTFKDLLANELITGNEGVGSGPYIYPKGLNGILGTRFKMVVGFPSANSVLLAMERQEIDGVCDSVTSVVRSRPDWIASKKVNVLFQGGVRPNPRLTDVPSIIDLARTSEEKRAIEFLYAGNGMGRPFIAPPDLPAQRVKMLRDAFMATMRDSEFIAEAKRLKLDVEPEDGEYLSAHIKKIYDTPNTIVNRVAELIK